MLYKKTRHGSRPSILSPDFWNGTNIGVAVTIFIFLITAMWAAWSLIQENTILKQKNENMTDDIGRLEQNVQSAKEGNARMFDLIVHLLANQDIKLETITPFLQEPVLKEINAEVDAAEAATPYPVGPTEETGIQKSLIFKADLEADEAILGDALVFEKASPCVVFLIRGPQKKEFWLTDGAWQRYKSVLTKQHEEGLINQRSMQLVAENPVCKNNVHIIRK